MNQASQPDFAQSSPLSGAILIRDIFHLRFVDIESSADYISRADYFFPGANPCDSMADTIRSEI
jgi:hypothetical protein